MRVLVGCKSDLEEEREVSEVMIMINIITITIIIIIISRSLKCKDKRLQRRWSPGTQHLMNWSIWSLLDILSRWRETSALSGSNVDLLFLELTKEMLVKRKPEGPTCNETSPDKLGGGREVMLVQYSTRSSSIALSILFQRYPA